MKAHRTDALSLAFGMLFVLIAVAFLANRAFDVKLPDMGLLVAAGVVVLGGVIAITALFPHRKQNPTEIPPVQDPVEVDENPRP
ncbi:hypothetical protein Rhe02_24610 [Rhizocola hellebori]|uniref:Uncharacterized protein n=1 Tax=Rhizocola hellebori TaxID=1392758 RepID=A0A8J3Q5Q1_9ACTN|nr:hypothetical protein [Rhizocola hellebori]GIH04394.1 hypothetical protein Rhe02_24610 [Rhizocola hellebori]